MHARLNLVLTAWLVLGSTASPGHAQSVPVLSRHAAGIEQKASRLAPQAPISVKPFKAEEEYGRFLVNGKDSFTFFDIDQKANVTLKYEAVKNIRNGYGGYNHATQRHVDRKKSLIIAGVVVGGLAALIIAAATAR